MTRVSKDIRPDTLTAPEITAEQADRARRAVLLAVDRGVLTAAGALDVLEMAGIAPETPQEPSGPVTPPQPRNALSGHFTPRKAP